MSRKKQTPLALETEARVASNIMNLRLSRGLSRQKLANQLGITHQQLHKYEKATNRISVGIVGDIASYFKVPMSYMVGENANLVNPSNHRDLALISIINSFSKIDNPKLKKALQTVISQLS